MARRRFRRSRKRRTFRRRSRSYRRRARRFTRRVRSVILRTAEPKHQVVNLYTYFGAVDNTWTEHDCFKIGEGTTQQTRIGEEVYVESIYFYGTLLGGQGAISDDAYNQVRIVVGLWAASAGDTPLNTMGADRVDPLWPKCSWTGVDPPQLAQQLRYKICDMQLVLRSLGMQSEGDLLPAVKKVKFYKRFRRPIKMTWQNTGTAYPKQRLIMSMTSDSSAAPSPGFIDGFLWIKYRDP